MVRFSCVNRLKRRSRRAEFRSVESEAGLLQPKTLYAAQNLVDLGQDLGTEVNNHFVAVALEYCLQSTVLLQTILSQLYADRAAVVRRPFLMQIAVFGYLFDVVRDVRAQIVAPQD